MFSSFNFPWHTRITFIQDFLRLTFGVILSPPPKLNNKQIPQIYNHFFVQSSITTFPFSVIAPGQSNSTTFPFFVISPQDPSRQADVGITSIALAKLLECFLTSLSFTWIMFAMMMMHIAHVVNIIINGFDVCANNDVDDIDDATPSLYPKPDNRLFLATTMLTAQ